MSERRILEARQNTTKCSQWKLIKINLLRERERQLIIIPDRRDQFSTSRYLQETKEDFTPATLPQLALLR